MRIEAGRAHQARDQAPWHQRSRPPGGRPCTLDLYWSIVLVLHLLRKNPTQQVAAAFFNISQATVSRRWDLLRPILAVVLGDLVEPDRTHIGRYGTALVDGTICPTWDWKHIPHLYSTKAGYPGINVQIACDLGGAIAAIGPIPVPGARHDAFAFGASGLKDSGFAVGDLVADPDLVDGLAGSVGHEDVSASDETVPARPSQGLRQATAATGVALPRITSPAALAAAAFADIVGLRLRRAESSRPARPEQEDICRIA